MTDDKGIPYFTDLRTHLANDGSHAMLDIIAQGERMQIAVASDQLTILIDQLQVLGRAWQDKRNATSSDEYPVAAIAPKGFAVGRLEDLGVGLMFHVGGPPITIQLSEPIAKDVADALLAELDRPTRK
nr:hypothetical protein [uncultured Shinella sp.]